MNRFVKLTKFNQNMLQILGILLHSKHILLKQKKPRLQLKSGF